MLYLMLIGSSECVSKTLRLMINFWLESGIWCWFCTVLCQKIKSNFPCFSKTFCFKYQMRHKFFDNNIVILLVLAFQVSVFNGAGPSLAVDGNKNRDYSQGSCIHTNLENDPWWRVDLGASLPVAEVVIVNRLCASFFPCASRMNAFEIRIGKAIFYFTF